MEEKDIYIASEIPQGGGEEEKNKEKALGNQEELGTHILG